MRTLILAILRRTFFAIGFGHIKFNKLVNKQHSTEVYTYKVFIYVVYQF